MHARKCRHGKKKLSKQQLLEAAEAKAQEAAAAEGNEEAKVGIQAILGIMILVEAI